MQSIIPARLGNNSYIDPSEVPEPLNELGSANNKFGMRRSSGASSPHRASAKLGMSALVRGAGGCVPSQADRITSGVTGWANVLGVQQLQGTWRERAQSIIGEGGARTMAVETAMCLPGTLQHTCKRRRTKCAKGLRGGSNDDWRTSDHTQSGRAGRPPQAHR